jgi:hypothetical protein
MTTTKVLISLAALAVAMSSPAFGPAWAKDKDRSIELTRAKDVVDRTRLPDPPVVSTGTVVVPIQRPPQQMPTGGSDIHRMKTNPPPPPGK